MVKEPPQPPSVVARSRKRQSKEAHENEPRNEIAEELVVWILSSDDGQSGCNGAEQICNALAAARWLLVVMNRSSLCVETSMQPENRTGRK